jgi:hypothetical protein
MEKPIKVTFEPAWDWHDVIAFLEEKYDIDVRDYNKKFSKGSEQDVEYLDFWHWVLGMYDVHNGSFIDLSVKYWLEEKSTPLWVKEILQKMYDEFQEEDMNFWVSW